MDDVHQMLDGVTMSKRQAAELESNLETDPDQPDMRVKLLGFYALRQGYGGTKEARVKHILWFIEHKPDFEFSVAPLMSYSSGIDADGHARLKEAWLNQVEAHPADAKVIANAARFLQVDDREMAENLFVKAKELAPDDTMLLDELANFYKVGAVSGAAASPADKSSEKALVHFEEAVERAEDELRRFYALTSLVEAAADAENFERAEAVALELLDIASKYTNDWNYGNAIFHANHALAQSALSKNDVESAAKYLIKASETPGSPQLDSFGPRFDLAGRLLELGQREVVLQYIRNCAKFWDMDMGACEKWLKQIQEGGTTDFNRYDNGGFSIWKTGRMLFKTLRNKNKKKK